MRMLNLTGLRFGRLLVEKRSSSKLGRDVAWDCLCDCGGSVSIRGSTLRNGRSQSCGCICKTTNGAASKRTSTYMSWSSMMSRCKNTNSHAYPSYGGRGITVCQRWASFNYFLEDMGERPPGTTLDRKDNDQGYTKENCRWEDQKTQSRNTRSNRLVSYGGVAKPISWWSEAMGWPHHVIASRLRAGWSDLKSLTTPRERFKEQQFELIQKLGAATKVIA